MPPTLFGNLETWSVWMIQLHKPDHRGYATYQLVTYTESPEMAVGVLDQLEREAREQNMTHVQRTCSHFLHVSSEYRQDGKRDFAVNYTIMNSEGSRWFGGEELTAKFAALGEELSELLKDLADQDFQDDDDSLIPFVNCA